MLRHVLLLLMDLLESMISASRTAGAEILRIRAAGFTVREKSDESPVTAADTAAEALILELLAKVAPGVPIVAEEMTAAGVVPALAHRFFLVDALDGTREFVAGRDEFTVNIALIEAGLPVLGVVDAPALGRLFAGDVRQGRALEIRSNDPIPSVASRRHAIRVRQAPPSGQVAVASRSHGSPDTEEWLRREGVVERVSIGSSLKFCLLACGEADIYPRLGPTMEWDTAAGHAVLSAAGGSVVDLEGHTLRYGKPAFRNPHFIAGAVRRP